ncbi:MAG: hypothetical protein FJ294_11885 [Planctomycetes bacterium]|nr:hypothetical protein [Planctomycetota bacterium]
MIAPILLACIQAAPSVDLLSLHAPTPHVLVDVPDVPALLDAYPSAPAMQLAVDPTAREAFSKLESNLRLDMADSLSSALALLGLDSGVGDVDLTEVARRALRVTVSYATEESMSGELAAELARVSEAQLEALDLEELLETDAAALLDERLSQDPWGRAYEVTRSPQGRPEVLSYGADGRPGGEGGATDIGSEFDVSRWLEIELGRRRALLLTIDFVSDDVARESWGSMRAALGALPSGPDETRALLDSSGAFERFEVARKDGASGWAWRAERRLVVSLGATTLEAVQARASAARSSFATEPTWNALLSLPLDPDGATVARGAVDTAKIAELLSGAIDQLPQSRENQPTFVTPRPTAFRMQLIGARFCTDIVRPPANESSWWRAFGGSAPTSSLRAVIPGDAAGALVTQLDARELERQFAAWAGLEGAGEARLRAVEQLHGFDLRRDVFGSIGSDVALFVMPVNSIGLPNAVAVMELRDPAAFERGMQGLANASADVGASSLSIRSARYRESPMWSFEMERTEPSQLPFEISPTVAIVGSRAVLTTTTLFAKREIKRLASEAASAADTSQPLELPPGATLAGRMDWPTMIASLYTSLRGAAALAGSFANLPIDLGALTAGLPDRPETFTRFFSTTLLSGAPLGERFHLHMESSFGPETWLGLVGFTMSALRSLPAASGASSDGSSAGIAARAEEATTEGEPARSLEMTRAALDRVATRLLVFQLDRGTYPDALEELARPSPNYPDGYLDGEALPVDGWGRALAYRRGADGAEYRIWSFGPDGLDATGDEVAP